MGSKLITWDEAMAKKELSKRLREAHKGREPWEILWRGAEQVIYSTSTTTFGQVNPIYPARPVGDDSDDLDGDSPNININLIQRDIRYIHSQMSSNPPSVAPVPFSSDSEDMRKSDAADRSIRYGRRQYKFDNTQDLITLQTLVAGSSFGLANFNPNIGDVLDFDEVSGDIQMEGDFEFTHVSVWDIYADPYAKSWDKVRYLFRKHTMSMEEALSMFPDKQELLDKSAKEQEDEMEGSTLRDISPQAATPDKVTLYQYWETGLPVNGFRGRYCWCLADGTALSAIEHNPHAFRFVTGTAKSEGSIIPKARLPIHILTDIDVPEHYYGMGVAMFSAEAQEMRNQFINASIETMRALGTPTLIIPDGAEMADESITSSPWNFIKIKGNVGPYQMEGARMPTGFSEMIDRLEKAISDQNSVNESNLGVQKREQAAALMQLASDQSNQIRRRLFNKYTKFIESIYRDYLDVIREHWTTKRKIFVLGKEKAFEVMDFDAMSITGGFDLDETYGTHFSLDPITRKDQIMQLIPLFREAGIPLRTLLTHLRMSDLSGIHDVAEMSADRQREIFEEMEANLGRGLAPEAAYIPPEEDEDHEAMAEFCKFFRASAEFKYKKPEVKELIRRHYKERLAMLGNAAQAMGGALPEAPAEGGGEAPPMDLGSMLGG
jgi:hypothetical protein